MARLAPTPACASGLIILSFQRRRSRLEYAPMAFTEWILSLRSRLSPVRTGKRRRPRRPRPPGCISFEQLEDRNLLSGGKLLHIAHRLLHSGGKHHHHVAHAQAALTALLSGDLTGRGVRVQAAEGVPFKLVPVAVFNDPVGPNGLPAPASEFKATIDWGDGSPL